MRSGCPEACRLWVDGMDFLEPVFELLIPALFYSSMAALMAVMLLKRREIARTVGVAGIALPALGMAAVFVVLAWTVPIHFPTYGDEFAYMDAAKSLAAKGRYVTCDYDSLEESCRLVDKPYQAYIMILALAFRAFGATVEVAAMTNVILGAMAVVLVSLVSCQLFSKRSASLMAAAMFALFPVNLAMAKSAETAMASVLFIVLTLFLFLAWKRRQEPMMLAAFMISLSLAVQARMENLLLIPLFVVGFALFGKKRGFRRWLPWLAFFALIAPHLMQVYALASGNAVAFTDSEGVLFSAGYMAQNALGAAYFLASTPQNALLTALFLSCLLLRKGWKRGERGFMALLFIGFFAAMSAYAFAGFSRFCAMGVDPYDQNLRYLMPAFSVIAIVASGGTEGFERFHGLRRHKNACVWLLPLLMLVLSSLAVSDLIQGKAPCGSSSVASYRGFLAMAPRIPANCMVMMMNSDLATALTELKGLDAEPALDHLERLKDALKGGVCVVYLETPMDRKWMTEARMKSRLKDGPKPYLGSEFAFRLLANESFCGEDFYVTLEEVTIRGAQAQWVAPGQAIHDV